MAELEIDKLLEYPNFVSIESIKASIPLEEDNFQLWYLYRVYNKDYLDADELERLDNLIIDMKTKTEKVNKYNLNKLKVNDGQ